MFGSIGQPVSGAKNERTARIFADLMHDEAVEREDKRRQSARRRQRFMRMVKGWFTSH